MIIIYAIMSVVGLLVCSAVPRLGNKWLRMTVFAPALEIVLCVGALAALLWFFDLRQEALSRIVPWQVALSIAAVVGCVMPLNCYVAFRSER